MAGRAGNGLAACTDFKERQNIRGALRELKGLKLDGDTVITHSFGPKSVKRAGSLTAPESENGRVFPKQTNYRSIDENSFLERKYNRVTDRGHNKRNIDKRIEDETEEKVAIKNTPGSTKSALEKETPKYIIKENCVQANKRSSNVRDEKRRVDDERTEKDADEKVFDKAKSTVSKGSFNHRFKRNSVLENTEDVPAKSASKFEVIKSNFERKSKDVSESKSNVKNVTEKPQGRSSVKEILSESFLNRVNEIKSTFEKQRDDKPKFRSYLYAGNLTTPTKHLEEENEIPVKRCVSVTIVTNEIKDKNSDSKESVIKRPVSLELKSNQSTNTNVSKDFPDRDKSPVKKSATPSPRKPRKISYRTSPFSPSSQLSPLNSSVPRNRLKTETTDDNFVSSNKELSGTDQTVKQLVSVQEGKQSRSDQTGRPLNSDQTGRHSVPILKGGNSGFRQTDRHLGTVETGHQSVSNQTGSVIDQTDGHLTPKQTGRRAHSGRRSVTNQTGRQTVHDSRPVESRVLVKRIDNKTTMKAETGRRHTSDSTLVIQKSKNEINDELHKVEGPEKIRSKSQGCNSEVISEDINMDVSVQKRRTGLSRKNRVDSSDSTKTTRKFRRKGKADDDPLTSPNTPQPHSDIIMSPVNGEFHAKPVQRSSHVRRKLPEIPVSRDEQDFENDETVHERTIRLLQERRKERLGKIIKEKEVEPKSVKSKVTPDKIKDLQEKLERSDSKRKACRVRRELQLLNRETKLKSPVAVNLEAEFSAILKAGEAVTDKENVMVPVKRSQSDVGRKPAKLELEVSSREPQNDVIEKKTFSSACKEVESLLMQPLTPDKKIDLIGSLMQEEAKLQELLRRSTSFTDKRKMRAEVRQLREKRNALEGASLPVPTLQRSASVSSGVITHASTPDGNRVKEPEPVNKPPTIDELRKQLSETSDYDEKKKIRLALRQLRQQSRDGTPAQTGLQRSQSFILQKTSETEGKSDTQSDSVPVFRSRSISDPNAPEDERTVKDTNKQTGSEIVDSSSLIKKQSSGKLETVQSQIDLRNSDRLRRKSGSDISGNSSLSQRPPVSSNLKQTAITNGDARVNSVEAGSLPPRAPKRHSFAAGNDTKLKNQSTSLNGAHLTDSKQRIQTNSVLTGTQKDSVETGNVKIPLEISKIETQSSEVQQQSGQPKETKFKSKFANILISRTNIDRRKSTSDLLDETRDLTSSISSYDNNKKLIRSETAYFKVTDSETKDHKSSEKACVKTDTDSDKRLTPNIEWLEDKKRTIPTPNELDKLMSSMDIEAAFSQILDAVETIPINGDIPEPQIPDSPIMEEESESSTSSVIELTNIAETKQKMDEGLENNSSDLDNDKVAPNGSDDKSVPKKQLDEIIDLTSDSQNENGEVNSEQVLNADCVNGAIHEDESKVKSEKTVQLPSNLSLDISQPPDTSNAISVIHGEDGTVTVQEVNRKEEGDTVITEWKKVRRTQSKSECRETDTVVEKRITSPGGNSHTYEKDVSKTKRKITSRGSEYFSRNHYNIRKRTDLEGSEIVEHELDSESANVSVSKNESWGERSEAKVILNRDGNNEIKPKRLSIIKNDSDGKSESELRPTEKSSVQTVDRASAGTKASSGYGSVSPSDEDHDLGAVVEAHLGRPSGCPEVISPLQNVTAMEGSTAVLEFKCKGHPTPNMTWYKGDNPLVDSNTVKFHFDNVSGKARLEISPVTPDDLGDYKCVLRNTMGTATTSGRLTVKHKTQTLPWFLTKLNDVSITEGQSITLECEVSDVDTVMWFKDGIIQRNSPDLRQTFDGKVAKLEIIEVYLDDDGTYSCVIKNKAGENGCSCKLAVKESQSNDTVVPMFLRQLNTQISDVGSTAIFEAEVIGSPVPTITWYENKNQLIQDGSHKIKYDGRIARLVLRKVSLSNGGKIECVAENCSGRVSSECMLVVQEVKKPPILKTQLSNVTFTSGQSAILECEVESDNPPEISWRKNDLVIGHMLDFKQTFIDGKARLEIGNACTQDSGKYDCCIKNEHGEIVTSCCLTIQDHKPKQEETQLPTKETKKEVTSVRSLPASFTPKIDNDKINQAKSSASKVMLVRQGSLRTITNTPQQSVLKRTGSYHGGTPVSVNKSVDNRTEVKLETVIKNPVSKILNTVELSSTNVTKVTDVKDVKTEIRTIEPKQESDMDISSTLMDKTHTVSDIKIKHVEKPATDKPTDNNLSDRLLLDEKESSKTADLDKVYTKDVNSNITKAGSNSTIPVDNNDKAMKLEIQIDSNKSKTSIESDKVTEKGSISTEKESVTTGKSNSFRAQDKSPLARFRTGNEIRRTQSTRTPGSEKPEWLQVKLRKVTKTPLSEREKQSIEKNTNYNTPSTSSVVDTPAEHSETPVSVHKEIKLSRSQSAKVMDKKTSPVLKDSTNSPSNDPARKTPIKLTPVSERAKMFLGNDSKSPSGKSSPTDIIAKAINLSRAESMKAPIGHRPLVVQRTGSFKTETERSSQSGDITLNLSPQQSKGQEKEGESGSTRKTIKVWDPSAPSTTKMDISKITDEEELNKMLNNCENFEERKKLRARIKEIRDAQMKEWDAKQKERESKREDAIKLKHRLADQEKQKRLDQFAAQAKESYDPKHLQMADQNLKEKYRQADLEKQRKLEAFDRMARKEDVKQTSKVTTEVSTDGKTTTTTRKVETTTSVAGRGATGRPAEEIAPQMLKQIVNTTSPSVSGQLSVKTESWSSKDGVTRTSEKTESWGAKPVNPFKAADAANAKTNPPKAMARSPSAIKTMLLDWCKAMTREYSDKIEITNFSTSWNDGIAFCALIHHFYPEAFDLYTLDPKQRRKNFELAFDTAEKYADIAPLLDVEDMVRMKKPDWKCVFTYVQSFYRKLKDHDMNKAKSPES